VWSAANSTHILEKKKEPEKSKRTAKLDMGYGKRMMTSKKRADCLAPLYRQEAPQATQARFYNNVHAIF
jgi:hypothetical protein